VIALGHGRGYSRSMSNGNRTSISRIPALGALALGLLLLLRPAR
jgi:hypothetical protein